MHGPAAAPIPSRTGRWPVIVLVVCVLMLLLVDYGRQAEVRHLGLRLFDVGLLYNGKTGHVWVYRRHDGGLRMTLLGSDGE